MNVPHFHSWPLVAVLSALTLANASAAVVVATVAPETALARSGLAAGDRLERWQSPRGSGVIESTRDLAALEIREAPFGDLVIEGARQGRAARWSISEGKWVATYAPSAPTAGDEGFDAIRAAGRLDALERWIASTDPSQRLGARIEAARGRSADERRRLFEGGLADVPGFSLEAAFFRSQLGNAAFLAHDWPAAEALWQCALEIRRTLAPGRRVEAETLGNLGVLAMSRGEYDAAERELSAALALDERFGPASDEVRTSLHNLAIVAMRRGHPDRARAIYRVLLAIEEVVRPETLDVARIHHNLGSAANELGLYDEAELHLGRARELRTRLAPDSAELSGTLNNLGALAQHRGQLALAEALFGESLAIKRRLRPRSLDVAITLHNLGVIAYRRGDLIRAESLLLDAYQIKQRLAPESDEVASSLSMLAAVARSRRDRARALAWESELLDLRCRIGLGSLAEAEARVDLAALANEVGDPAQARTELDHARRLLAGGDDALALAARVVRTEIDLAEPTAAHRLARDHLDLLRYAGIGGIDEASALAELADTARRLGRVAESRGHAEAALTVLRREAPGVELEAAIRARLAALDRLGGDDRRALAELDRAAAIVDRLGGMVGGEREDADRFRATLREIERQRVELRLVLGPSAAAFEQLESTRARSLRRLLRQSDAESTIEPEAFGPDRLLPELPPGTLYVAFSVGEQATVVGWLSAPDGNWNLLRLPIGEPALAARVRRIRLALAAGRADSAPLEALDSELLAPLAAPLASATRLVISPDGPLHFVPWAALPRLADRPLSLVSSARVYTDLRAGAGRRIDSLLLAADPEPPPAGWPALPGARAEVRAIAAAHGAGACVLFGRAAGELRLRSEAIGFDALHLAVHGTLAPEAPLDSALHLVADGGSDGRFTAREIFAGPRLGADLIVLSACDSGGGEELGDEGILGLVRAFQVAGARTVVASLWPVDDEATADLMARFWRRLDAGDARDVALRRAQAELAATGAGPGAWAPFVVIGASE